MASASPSKTSMNSPSEAENEAPRKWSDLPKDVLFRIALNLNFQTDLTRIRGVCPEWRSSLSLSDFPLQINHGLRVPPLKPFSSKVLLLHSRFYFLSPLTPSDDDRRGLAGKWVARIGEMGPKRHLFNPFNLHDYFFPEPPISASFNLLDCRISELACVFSLLGDDDDNAKTISKKVVGGYNLDSGYLFAVLAELEHGGLVFWKGGDKKWTRMEITSSFRVMDIAYHKGKFFAFELSGWRIGVIEPSNGSKAMEFIPAPEILSDPIDDMFSLSFNGKVYILGGCHFVSSNGRLYLVVVAVAQSDYDKKDKGTVFVFVLKEEVGDDRVCWEHVKSLGDEIFFIGHDASFSLPSSSANLPQWKPNSICLFTHPFPLIFDHASKSGHVQKLPEGAEQLDSINYAEYWRYFSVFCMDEEEKGIRPFKKLCKKTYTGLFFPPPPWVKWRCPSRGDVEVRLDGLTFSGERNFTDENSEEEEEEEDEDDEDEEEEGEDEEEDNEGKED